MAADYYHALHGIKMSSGHAYAHSIYITVSDQSKDYVLKQFNISDIISSYNQQSGVFTTPDGSEYSFWSDDATKGASLIFYSGSVVTAAVPDAEGYVNVYVEKTARRYDVSVAVTGDGVPCQYKDEAFDDVRTINFVAIAYPKDGTTLAYVPAGDYTVKLSNVPEQYVAKTKKVTVNQTTDVQELTIVLEDAHIHSADTSEWLNNEKNHWHKCSGCDEKLDVAAHTLGPAATEETPQTCTVCSYEMAPKLEHQHDYKDAYEKDATNHWNECTTCGANENVEPHTPGPEATEEAPQTCTVCGYEIAPIKEHVHAFGEEYSKDADKHWKVCASCRKMSEEASHTFGWVIDKEATETVAGSKHEECSICAYKKAAVEIPATGENKPQPTPDDDEEDDEPEPTPTPVPAPAQENKTEAPKTGDNTPYMLFIILFIMGVAVLVSERVVAKYKKH